MYAYKMFNKDLTCTRGKGAFKYKIGEWIEEPEANCAKNGFHCAEDPLDCLTYYPDWDSSRCFLVETGGSIDEDGLDTKISCTRIRLEKELNLKQFVAAAAMYMIRHPHLQENSLVKHEDAEPGRNHFVICRGKNKLKARGVKGDVIAILQEDEDGEITSARIMEIDGSDFLPGKWYDVDGKEIEDTDE